MTCWAIYLSASGALVQTFVSPTHPRFNGFDWESGVHTATALEEQPDPARQRWDSAALAFVDDLDALRARRWAEAKARRDVAEWAGCATPLGIADTDPDSQRKVGGAVQMAMIAQSLGQPFALDWTMKNNVSAVHDAPAMILMGVAVGQHVAACHEIGLAKRAAIDAAEDAAAIAAVDTEGGWPNA